MGWYEVSGKGRPGTHPAGHDEQGVIKKDWGGRLPVAVIYPNSYFIGMSNLGIHTVYSLANAYGDVVCERIFFDDPPHLSIESRRPPEDFAVLAFSISYELDYFNVIRFLKESGIPTYAAERDGRHPLVIAGGACVTANPAPLLPFFDCFCIGEAEPIIPDILPVLRGAGSREETLKALAGLPGLLVPGRQNDTTRVGRRWQKRLDDFLAGTAVFTEDTELGDMFLMEVERGCSWGCRFCLVSGSFCPIRFHSIERLIEKAEKGLMFRKRIGLVGPVVSDHPHIEELLARLRGMGAGLSVSSMRVKPISTAVIKELVAGGGRSLSLAPEAGSDRLRSVINKNISGDDILHAVSLAAGKGIRQLKLYFMVGLPTETDEDIEEMARLVLRCKDEADKAGRGSRLAINAAVFIPKAGTPFQWLPMTEIPVLERRLNVLKKRLAPKGIKVKSESPAWSHIQGALSRGDSRLAVILAGAEKVSLADWGRAISKAGMDIRHYTTEKWDAAQPLPWDMIDLGVPKEHLVKELGKALS